MSAFTGASYSEGTFTPTLTFATMGNASFTMTTQLGKWTRIGNLVHVKVNLVFTVTHTTASGNLQCSLPFTSANDSITDYGVCGSFNNVVCGAGVVPVSVVLAPNVAIATFLARTEATNADAAMTIANLTTGATSYTMNFAYDYFAA